MQWTAWQKESAQDLIYSNKFCILIHLPKFLGFGFFNILSRFFRCYQTSITVHSNSVSAGRHRNTGKSWSSPSCRCSRGQTWSLAELQGNGPNRWGRGAIWKRYCQLWLLLEFIINEYHKKNIQEYVTKSKRGKKKVSRFKPQVSRFKSQGSSGESAERGDNGVGRRGWRTGRTSRTGRTERGRNGTPKKPDDTQYFPSQDWIALHLASWYWQFALSSVRSVQSVWSVNRDNHVWGYRHCPQFDWYDTFFREKPLFFRFADLQFMPGWRIFSG